MVFGLSFLLGLGAAVLGLRAWSVRVWALMDILSLLAVALGLFLLAVAAVSPSKGRLTWQLDIAGSEARALIREKTLFQTQNCGRPQHPNLTIVCNQIAEWTIKKTFEGDVSQFLAQRVHITAVEHSIVVTDTGNTKEIVVTVPLQQAHAVSADLAATLPDIAARFDSLLRARADLDQRVQQVMFDQTQAQRHRSQTIGGFCLLLFGLATHLVRAIDRLRALRSPDHQHHAKYVTNP